MTTLAMLTTIIVALITAVIGPLLMTWFKNKLETKPTKKLLEEAIDLNELVSEQLEIIIDELEADRIWIAQFHNGGHFYPTGKSIAKFSIMYETVNTGVSSIQTNYQNIPVHLFSKSLNQLVTGDIIEIPDFTDVTIATYGLRYAAEESGCKSSYLFAIKAIDGKFIGVLGIDYTKNKTQLDDDVITNIMIHASSLGGVLINHLEH